MANPFQGWSQEMVDAFNSRTKRSAKEVGQTESARFNEGNQPSATVTPGGANPGTNTRQFTIEVEPCPAPRMTRRDKWLKPRRPCVQRYFDYRDHLQRAVGDLPVVPDELHCRFYLSMPESWPKGKRQAMEGQPHRSRPDRDNLDKAVSDALFLEDGGVWKGSQEKFWAVHGCVVIEMRWL